MLTELMRRRTIGVLRPYLDDTILFLVSQCRDPYSTVKVEALDMITRLALHPHLEQVRCCALFGKLFASEFSQLAIEAQTDNAIRVADHRRV